MSNNPGSVNPLPGASPSAGGEPTRVSGQPGAGSDSASIDLQPGASPPANGGSNSPLRVIITGTTGMVGEGVLHECLQHPGVEAVLLLNRKPLGLTHPKLREIVHTDFYDLSAIESQLTGYNACFFCLGVSSVGLGADDYYKVTYTLTMHVAETLSRLNPPAAGSNGAAATATGPTGPPAIVPEGGTALESGVVSHPDIAALGAAAPADYPIPPGNMVFAYVSGAGTDSTEKGRSRWARVKGKTENDLMLLPFRRVYAFRPGFIRPIPGLSNAHKFYKYIGWLFPVGRALYPAGFATLSEVGLAMIHLALRCDGDAIVSGKDIIRYAAAETAGGSGQKAAAG